METLGKAMKSKIERNFHLFFVTPIHILITRNHLRKIIEKLNCSTALKVYFFKATFKITATCSASMILYTIFVYELCTVVQQQLTLLFFIVKIYAAIYGVRINKIITIFKSNSQTVFEIISERDVKYTL